LTLPSTPARLVCSNRLDLALPEQSALSVDLLGRENVSLDRRFRHHGERSGEKGHMGGHIVLVGNVALDPGRRSRRVDQRRSHVAGNGAGSGGADGEAHPAQEFSAGDVGYFRHAINLCHDFISSFQIAALQQSSVTPALPESTRPGVFLGASLLRTAPWRPGETIPAAVTGMQAIQTFDKNAAPSSSPPTPSSAPGGCNLPTRRRITRSPPHMRCATNAEAGGLMTLWNQPDRRVSSGRRLYRPHPQ
jgi:hypothetical protein